jgi:hypothetical protein
MIKRKEEKLNKSRERKSKPDDTGCKLYVGNLSRNVTDDELMEQFKVFIWSFFFFLFFSDVYINGNSCDSRMDVLVVSSSKYEKGKT